MKMVILRKSLRKIQHMAKNMVKRGRSARNGNAPSPYTKYQKTEYKYSTAYYDWRRGKIAKKSKETKQSHREYKEAAE